MKIANKINLSFSIVVVVLVGISLSILYTAAKSSLEKAIFEHLSTTAQSRARHIETFLEEDKVRLALLAESDLIEDGIEEIIKSSPNLKESSKDLSLILKDFHKKEEEAYEFLVLNPDGKVIASTDEGNVGTDESSEAHFLGGKDRVYIRDAYHSKEQKPEYSISAPIINDNTKEFLGILVGRFKMDDINKITMDRSGLGKTGELYLVNKYGYMITRSRFKKDTFLRQKVDTINYRTSVSRATHSGTHTGHGLVHIFPDYRGVNVVGTHDYISEMEWSLLAEIDEKEALAPLAVIKLLFIIIFCAVPVVVWAVGTLVSRAITTPIQKLRKSTEIIGEGNLDTQIKIESNDEIGKLAQSFNEMTINLKRTTTSVDNLSDEIDERKQIEEVLTERIKELRCMYGVANSIRLRETLQEIFMDVVMLIPHGWRYPEITQARIICDENDYVLETFEESPWKQSSNIVVNGHVRGRLEVYYKEERPEYDEGPFLKEERHLIDNIAHALSEAVEHNETEQKLHQIQTAMEDATDAIAITNEEGHIIYINAAFGNLFKYAAEETETIDFDSIFINPTIGANAYRESLNGGFWTGETEMVSSDGQVFPAYLRSTSITDKNLNNLGVLFVINNISELKEAERRQAKLLEQVESVNDELKSFAYIISHDLKAPLRGISSLANWLSDDYSDALGEDGKQQMDLLKSRVVRMQDLIDGVLQYSRVGRVKEEVVDVELNNVVPEVIDLLAAPENISITVDNDLPTISVEKTRISQLFQNILSNSIKYMDKPQGQIHVGCVEEDDDWRFSISDNGPGIEEKHFEKIFQIFQTVSEGDSYESTGVGLSVVKKIVEIYGGRIWVESEVGNGCTFFFTLSKKTEVQNEELQTNAIC